MIDSDKKQFATLLKQACNEYETLLTKDMVVGWWNQLNKYEFNQVENVFDEWLKENKKLPTHENILMLINPVTIRPRNETPLTKENGRQRIEQIKSIKTDKANKDWARKLLDSPKGKEAIAIKFAKIALNINE